MFTNVYIRREKPRPTEPVKAKLLKSLCLQPAPPRANRAQSEANRSKVLQSAAETSQT
jgi:hypothetical protein